MASRTYGQNPCCSTMRLVSLDIALYQSITPPFDKDGLEFNLQGQYGKKETLYEPQCPWLQNL